MALPTQSIGGLISGFDTATIIQTLMELQRRPIYLLEAQIEKAQAQQLAIQGIAAQALQVKLNAYSMTRESTFEAKTGTSNNDLALGVTADYTASLGSYSFRIGRLAQAHQLASTGFENSDEAAVGTGTLSFEVGNGFVDDETTVDFLNGQQGIYHGLLKITDRSGATATIDLSLATTVQEILDTISNTDSIDVTAQLSSTGNGIEIVDDTELALSNLIIDEVGDGTTAQDIGIYTGPTGVADDIVEGSDINYVAGNTKLAYLNDGLGVYLGQVQVTDRAGATDTVDLSGARTLQDVIDIFADGAQNTTSVRLGFAAEGRALRVTSGAGGGNIIIADVDAAAAADLGIATAGSAADFDGESVIATLNTVLRKTTTGAQGTGAGIVDGEIDIQDRNGMVTRVDITGIDTVQGIVDIINETAQFDGVQIRAEVNDVGNGIKIVDTSGATAFDLAVSEVAAGTTAASLGILGSVSADTLQGTDLDRQYISRSTALDALNRGEGVFGGKFEITDTNDIAFEVNISATSVDTIGEVLDRINAAATAAGSTVTARINDTGDGILVEDLGGGPSLLRIAELAGGTAAQDLNILGTGATQVDGAYEYSVTTTATDTLEDVAAAINNLDIGISVGVINDGTFVDPYRLSLISEKTGHVGRIAVTSTIADFSFSEAAKANDAVLLSGSPVGGASPMQIVKTTNTVSDAIKGVTLELKEVSASSINVNITRDLGSVKDSIGTFVENYNNLINTIREYAGYDEEAEEGGLLFGNTALRLLEDEISSLIVSAVEGVPGTMNQFVHAGITFMRDGNLDFNATTFDEAVVDDFDDLKNIFTYQANLALEAGASISLAGGGTDPGFDLENIRNGDTSSNNFGPANGWQGDHAMPPFDFITLDFGQTRQVSQFQIHHLNSDIFPLDQFGMKRFRLEYWDTSTGMFEELRTVDNNQSDVTTFSLVDTVYTDRVRLVAEDNYNADNKTRLIEFEVYEKRGIASRIDDALKRFTDSVDGSLVLEKTTFGEKVTSLQDEIVRMEEILDKREISLLREFTNLEKILAELQAQSNYFTAHMDALKANAQK